MKFRTLAWLAILLAPIQLFAQSNASNLAKLGSQYSAIEAMLASSGGTGFISGTQTSTYVIAHYPPASNAGKSILTSDMGLMACDGVRWKVMGTPPIPAGAALLGYVHNAYTVFPVQSEIVLSRGTTKSNLYAGLSYYSTQPIAGSFGTDATTGQLQLFFNQASNPSNPAQIATVTSQNTTSLTVALGNIPPSIGSKGFYYEAAYTIPTDNANGFNAFYLMPWQHNTTNADADPSIPYTNWRRYHEFDINENGHGTDSGGLRRGAYIKWSGGPITSSCSTSNAYVTLTLTANPSGSGGTLASGAVWQADSANTYNAVTNTGQNLYPVTLTNGSGAVSWGATPSGATSASLYVCGSNYIVNNSHTTSISYTTEHIFGAAYDPVGKKYYVWIDGALQDTLSTAYSGADDTFRDAEGYVPIFQMADTGSSTTPGTMLLRYFALWTP